MWLAVLKQQVLLITLCVVYAFTRHQHWCSSLSPFCMICFIVLSYPGALVSNVEHLHGAVFE